MHVEIKVAQSFVLNFLFNKLPRRRVNLFGEELESALVDKFQDHWYPDMPFKGSAYRCLRVTDPNDPVLNRAARESGNPVSDIIENLPADLAIWIDPGEVSYRIGEKGTVKILFSESTSGWGTGSSPGISPGGGGAATQTGNGNGGSGGLHTSSSTSSGASDDLNAEVAGYLPMDNLNSALSALSINVNTGGSGGGSSQAPPPSGPPTAPPSVSNMPPPMNGGPAMTGGFTPFQPRPHHQPITYTAGTFAQTKFGSTKLKTNGKKTNRMSPTEFSNYIKQRALQKQNSVGSCVNSGGGHFNQMRSGGTGSNVGFRPLQAGSGGMGGSGFGGGSFGGMGHPSQQQQQPMNGQPSGGSNMGFRSHNRNNGGMGSNNDMSDSFFFPLFPDRGNGSASNNSNSNNFGLGNGGSGSSFMGGTGGSGGGGGGSTSMPSSGNANRTSNPWSFVDTDTESFLQDILTVGLQQSSKQNRDIGFFNGPSPASGNAASDLGSAGSSSASSASDFGGTGLSSAGLFGERFGPLSGEDQGKGVIGEGLGNRGSSGTGEKYPQQRALVAN